MTLPCLAAEAVYPSWATSVSRLALPPAAAVLTLTERSRSSQCSGHAGRPSATARELAPHSATSGPSRAASSWASVRRPFRAAQALKRLQASARAGLRKAKAAFRLQLARFGLHLKGLEIRGLEALRRATRWGQLAHQRGVPCPRIMPLLELGDLSFPLPWHQGKTKKFRGGNPGPPGCGRRNLPLTVTSPRGVRADIA